MLMKKQGRPLASQPFLRSFPVIIAAILLICSTFSHISAPSAESTAPTEGTGHLAAVSGLIRPDRDLFPKLDFPLEENSEIFLEWMIYNMGFSGIPMETAPAKSGQIKVACVGDSITYGYGLLDWTQNNYPVLLQELLGEHYHVQNFGANGSCVQEDADHPYSNYGLYSDSIRYETDILVFMMGSNDSKPENWQGEEVFRSALCSLLDSYGDVRIVLCTPSICFETEGPADLEQSGGYDLQPAVIDHIARVIREIAAERGYPLVDIHALTAANPQWLEHDGVHPNIDGAAAIAEAVWNVISQMNSGTS